MLSYPPSELLLVALQPPPWAKLTPGVAPSENKQKNPQTNNNTQIGSLVCQKLGDMAGKRSLPARPARDVQPKASELSLPALRTQLPGKSNRGCSLLLPLLCPQQNQPRSTEISGCASRCQQKVQGRCNVQPDLLNQGDSTPLKKPGGKTLSGQRSHRAGWDWGSSVNHPGWHLQLFMRRAEENKADSPWCTLRCKYNGK